MNVFGHIIQNCNIEMPSIFGENLFNDDWMDFSFPDVDKALYGKHAKNVMNEYSLRIGELVFFGVFVNILVKTGLVYNGYLSDFIAR